MAKELHGVYLGWAKRYISLNSWRVEGNFDDCLQEAQVKFIQCQNKYGEIDPPHLMSLFQSAFIRHIHTLSDKRTRYRSVQKESVIRHGQYIREGIRGTCDARIDLLNLQTKLWKYVTQLEFMAMAIKQELYEATGYTGDSSEGLLKRIYDRDCLTDDAYEALSVEAQDWLDRAITASNNDRPLPSLTTPNEKPTTKRTASKQGNGSVGNKVGRRGRFSDASKISLTIRGNPKRENTIAFSNFARYKEGMTVKEFLDLGGTRRDLSWDVDKSYIRVTS